MNLFGQEVDPWDLFLVFILLLGAAGLFGPPPQDDGGKSPKSSLFPGPRRRSQPYRTGPRRVGTLPAR